MRNGRVIIKISEHSVLLSTLHTATKPMDTSASTPVTAATTLFKMPITCSTKSTAAKSSSQNRIRRIVAISRAGR